MLSLRLCGTSDSRGLVNKDPWSVLITLPSPAMPRGRNLPAPVRGNRSVLSSLSLERSAPRSGDVELGKGRKQG